jgi:tRNA G18 (ribose-2'-O)-methylase SpoU
MADKIPLHAHSKSEISAMTDKLMAAGICFGIEKNEEGKAENLVIF